MCAHVHERCVHACAGMHMGTCARGTCACMHAHAHTHGGTHPCANASAHVPAPVRLDEPSGRADPNQSESSPNHLYQAPCAKRGR